MNICQLSQEYICMITESSATVQPPTDNTGMKMLYLYRSLSEVVDGCSLEI